MDNLYKIIDKKGNSIPFVLNELQAYTLKNLHIRNIILKARQLGMTTFSVLYMLDEAMFKANTQVGIVSYSLEHSQHIFKRIIGKAIDSLSPSAKLLSPIKARSAREITFENGSFIRVDTSLRGGTYNALLVSEFGKTCARNPLKAEEVVTGTLESASADSLIIIESTGEGNSGYYADMVTQSVANSKREGLSALEYKLFFFPWFQEKTYVSFSPMDWSTEYTDYFKEIEKKENITLKKEQKNWYISKRQTLGEKIKQEFPSNVQEAFLSSSEGFYFQKHIEKAYKENRMVSVEIYDPLEPLYLSMDIGVADETVLVFFQVVNREIRIVDSYNANGLGAVDYASFLINQKKYHYHTIFLPHDAKKRDGIIVENSYEREFRKMFSHTNTRIIVLKQTDKNLAILEAQTKFNRCIFALISTKHLIDMLYKYRRQWSEKYGKYLHSPMHDDSSHFGDSFVYAMEGVRHIEAFSNTSSSLEKHKDLAKNRRIF